MRTDANTLANIDHWFWARINKNGPTIRPELGPCWIWTGPCHPRTGYAQARFNGSLEYTHRIAFFLANGRFPTPQGCHHCDNPPCVRDSHIFEGTARDNSLDRFAKRRLGAAAERPTRAAAHPVIQEIDAYRRSIHLGNQEFAEAVGIHFVNWCRLRTGYCKKP